MATVGLVTGGASGIGAGIARRLRQRGADVLIADVDDAGRGLADEIGAAFFRCDVSDLDANRAAVAAAVDRFGGLDLAVLNAGLTSGTAPGDDDFDLARYRRVMGVNLDGVVFGVVAALPALRARGGGDVVATASLAGLTAVPEDPLYVANKHAVVGLVRSLGLGHAAEGIRINALCPGFADTPLIDGNQQLLRDAGFPILSVDEVVAAFEAIVEGTGTGECWYVQAGRPSAPFEFRRVPGPRVAEPSTEG